MTDNECKALEALEADLRLKAAAFARYKESGAVKQGAAYLDAADRLGAILNPPKLTWRVIVTGSSARGADGEAQIRDLCEKDALEISKILNARGVKAGAAVMP